MKPVALITGASRGIGRAVALRLAHENCHVALHYRTHTEGALQTARECRAMGADAWTVQADITDEEAVRGMIREAQKRFGHIDILVNNAGIAETALFTDITAAMWKHMLDVHVNGAYYACSAVLPEMIRRKSGRIINISSMWGQVGGSCEVHYSTAKAALIGMTKALAKELAPSGITVNCVSPGAVDTDMMASFTREERDDLACQTPLGRLAKPEEIAGAVAFLVSDDAAFMTGQVIAVNGGLVI